MVESQRAQIYNQRKRGEPIPIDAHIGERSIFKEACNHYGAKCMLSGRITGSDILTVHHIVPIGIGGETTLRNVALLVDSKHQIYNQLENFSPDLSMDVNAFLYEYHGECRSDVIISRVHRIMTFAEGTIGLKEAVTKIKKDKKLGDLLKLKKHIDDDEIDFSVIPDLYDALDSIILCFPDLGGEVRRYLSVAESCENNVLVLKRIKKILALVEWKKELDLEDKSLCAESISLLESTKDVLRKRIKELKERNII